MPADPLTTIVLILLSLLSAAGVGVAIARLRGARRTGVAIAITTACAIGSTLLLGYRLVMVHEYVWQPLQAHVDGLILVAALLAAALAYLQHPDRLPGVALFGMPLLLVVLTWGICASHWTLQPFHRGAVVRSAHLLAVYLGTTGVVLAAVGGALYLLVSRKLKSHTTPRTGPMASLERIERFIVHTAAIGFAAMTVGLVTGGIILSTEPTRFGQGWWYAPKLVLAVIVWLVFAMVMTVRYGSFFRGRRAAWLSIAGLVGLFAVWITVTASSAAAASSPAAAAPSPDASEIQTPERSQNAEGP